MFSTRLLLEVIPSNYVPGMLQQMHFINTYTNPDSGHKSKFIRQNEMNMANEPFKVQQVLLGSSSEINKLPCITNTEHSPVTKISVMGTNFSAQER